MDEIVNTYKENPETIVQVPPWLLATNSDLYELDFEAPIHDCRTTEAGNLGDLFQAALQPNDVPETPASTPQNHVYMMLRAITQMHFKPQEVNEPFGALFIMGNQRSAIPSDFRNHVDIIAEMANRAKNVVLRARLSDLCWLLERKRSDMALAAISAYGDIVQKTDQNELQFSFSDEQGALQPEAKYYLLRALLIDRAIGSNKSETTVAKNLVVKLRMQAAKELKLVPLHWFSELDLDFNISEADEVAEKINEVLGQEQSDSDSHIIVNLWNLAARGYRIVKMEEDKNRCLSEAAEQWVKQANASASSAMLASHFLGTAIQQLHGIPNKKERRKEIQHLLVDVQENISEEMNNFSHEMDLTEIAENVQKGIKTCGFFEKLFFFAALQNSPDPLKLQDDAEKSIRNHPLSSMFGVSHMDREGKVIHRSAGSLGDNIDNSAIQNQIAQAESIRRSVFAFGSIEAARSSIFNHHFICDDILVLLLQHSPFIPRDLLLTFSRGFKRFFQGDHISAVYILTPLLENSLRHILKSNSHIVSTFDNATGTQEDRGISQLFDQMRYELDALLSPAIASDIERLFLSKPGPHLRHALAHGLLHDNDPYGADAIYACWLIFRLCLLPLFSHRKEILEKLKDYQV